MSFQGGSNNPTITNNVISANGQIGLFINNCLTPLVDNNKVGTNASGTGALGNGERGIALEAGSNNPTITNNVISANGQTGLFINNCLAPTIDNNKIGTNAAGTVALGNVQRGLTIESLSHNPRVINNVISSNSQTGLFINNCLRPLVENNKIGTNLAGTAPLGNGQRGVTIENNSNYPIVRNNIVSSNLQLGVLITTSIKPIVTNNIIGADVTGMLALGNGANGLEISNLDSALIGGPGGRNIIVNNFDQGILFFNVKEGIIQSNFVGVGADGGVIDAPILGNGVGGVTIIGGGKNILIGGSLASHKNVVSYNGRRVEADGIKFEGVDSVTVLGNYCGVDVSGTRDRGNLWAGISANGTTGSVIGGAGAFEANICSGNHHEGIFLSGANFTTVVNNLIGTDLTGTLPIGNDGYGIRFGENFANFDNVIGGSAASANIIAFTYGTYTDTGRDDASVLGPGVFVDTKSQRNEITFNNIFCNAGLGIELEGAANENIPAPVITITDENTATGTGVPNDILHLYVNNATYTGGTGCGCEGETYVGTTTVTAGGTWSFTHNLNFTSGDTRSLNCNSNKSFSTNS